MTSYFIKFFCLHLIQTFDFILVHGYFHFMLILNCNLEKNCKKAGLLENKPILPYVSVDR